MYTPQHIANFFILKAQEEGIRLSPLKLMKLVYIGYGWAAAILDLKLFEEPIEAWTHGPVIPSLYHEFKGFRSSGIDRLALNYDLDSQESKTPAIPKEEELFTLLEIVWDVYKRFSGWDLRDKTHEHGTPWSKVNKQKKEDSRTIPFEPIRDHFAQRIQKYIDAIPN